MFLLMTASAAALATANTSAVANNPELAVEQTIIVTGTRLPQGAAEVIGRPGGTDLVLASEYKDKLAVSLKDALAFSPGVYAQPRFGQEVRISVRGSGISRGYHMRGLTLLQDGIPINLADDNGDFQELDPTTLDRLEIYRGANAFRFGGTTLGGAINGVTPTGRKNRGISLRGDGGSFDTTRGSLTAGWASADFDTWASIAGDRSDGDRQHARRKALRFNGNAGYAVDGFTTRFYVSANTIRQELPGALNYATVTTRPRSGNFAGDQGRNIDSLRLQNRTTLSFGEVELEGGAFLNIKSLEHPIYQFVDQDSNDKGLFLRAGWERGALQLLSGVTARFGSVDSRRFVNVNGQRGARTFAADLTARTIDLYGEGRLQVTHGLTAIAGAVYTNGTRKQVQSFPLAVTGKASFDQLSPRFGLLWEPSRKLQVYANLSRSHELPGFIELAQVARFVPLDAQHAWTGEVGVRGKLGPVKLDFSAYRANVRNELLQFTVSPDVPASTFNAGKTIHQGIEAGLEVPLTSWANLRSAYQFNDFRFDGDAQYGNNRLPVVPQHLLRAEVRLGPDGWAVTPGIEWVPQGAYADYRNTFRTAGYTLFNLGGSLTITPTTEAFVDLRNLTNRKAAGDITAVIAYSPTAQIFFPVERRALYLGVRQKFGGRK